MDLILCESTACASSYDFEWQRVLFPNSVLYCRLYILSSLSVLLRQVVLLFEKRLKAALSSPFLGQLEDEFRSVWSQKQRALLSRSKNHTP